MLNSGSSSPSVLRVRVGQVAREIFPRRPELVAVDRVFVMAFAAAPGQMEVRLEVPVLMVVVHLAVQMIPVVLVVTSEVH